MPKTKGMTSLEIAIIVAIVLVIAIAVGWYLYTTFAAAGQQTGLTIMESTIQIDKKVPPTDKYLLLKVVPQGAAQVQIQRIEVGGKVYSCPIIIDKQTWVRLKLDQDLVAGQTISGRVILGTGTPALFTAGVRAVDNPDQPPESGAQPVDC